MEEAAKHPWIVKRENLKQYIGRNKKSGRKVSELVF